MPAGVGFWGGLSCLVGRHARSRGQARATPEGWVSRCARCAIPMARAHGGGKWEVVKTPKRGKANARVQAKEVLAKAIVRSRKAGQRREEKAAKITSMGAPLPEWDAEDVVVVAERKRGLFRGKPSDGKAKGKRGRRLLFLRRKAGVEAVETAPIEMSLPNPAETPAKAKRKLFRRRREARVTEENASEG